jgi:hypothetical protein
MLRQIMFRQEQEYGPDSNETRHEPGLFMRDSFYEISSHNAVQTISTWVEVGF